jgi:hypothetical protein
MATAVEGVATDLDLDPLLLLPIEGGIGLGPETDLLKVTRGERELVLDLQRISRNEIGLPTPHHRADQDLLQIGITIIMGEMKEGEEEVGKGEGEGDEEEEVVGEEEMEKISTLLICEWMGQERKLR